MNAIDLAQLPTIAAHFRHLASLVDDVERSLKALSAELPTAVRPLPLIPGEDRAKLARKPKGTLVSLARARGVAGVSENRTKAELIDLIVKANIAA